jgi:AraC-like DNA-binding protein
MKTPTSVNRFSFTELLNLFTRISEHSYVVAKHLGQGYVQVYNLEKGLQVRLWNVAFLEDTELYSELDSQYESSYYTLAFFLNTDGLKFYKGAKFLPENIIWDTVFITAATNYKIHISSMAKGCCLGISFSSNWLRNNVFINDSSFIYLEERIFSLQTLTLHESMTASEKMQVQELMENTCKNLLGTFYIKTCILKIVYDFFYRVKDKELEIYNSSVYDPISEIEKHLHNNITGSLPNLKELAKKLALSESTILRHFKKAYGVTISAYFMRKKIKYAQQLIIEGDKSIEETATLIGLKNVNNLKTMMKKYSTE